MGSRNPDRISIQARRRQGETVEEHVEFPELPIVAR
jgi:hypothetical protein